MKHVTAQLLAGTVPLQGLRELLDRFDTVIPTDDRKQWHAKMSWVLARYTRSMLAGGADWLAGPEHHRIAFEE